MPIIFLQAGTPACSYPNKIAYPADKKLQQSNEQLRQAGDLKSQQRKQQHLEEGLTIEQLKSDFKGIQAKGKQRPISKQTEEYTNQALSTKDSVLEQAKTDCAQLFKVGTKDYGNCVMELID